MQYATIGTVSRATLRPQDLISAFADHLAFLIAKQGPDFEKKDYESLVAEAAGVLEEVENESCGEDAAQEFIDRLTESLNEFSPPYVTFGSHPGDGSDFGFWPDLESLEMDRDDGEVLSVSDLAKVPDGYIGPIMVVNDHGNVTFGMQDDKGNFESFWDCV